MLHGDAGSEQFCRNVQPGQLPRERHMSMEGIYEYGSRAACGASCASSKKTRGWPLTVFGVATACSATRDGSRLRRTAREIACHGLKVDSLPERR